jgi:hypothetical protein
MDKSVRYKVEGYRGIAFYCIGYEVIRDEDYEWSGIETEDRSRVRMIMVGDDRVHVVDVEDCTPIKEDEYCPECGQIGCTAYAGVFSDV